MAQPTNLAVSNVHIVTMEDEEVLTNKTVLIENEKIVKIQDSDKVIPKGYKVIDGKNRFLMPGLFDMHMHFISDDRIASNYLNDELVIPLKYGVLYARIMLGRPRHLTTSNRVRRGELLGPRLFCASPQLTGVNFSSVFHGEVVETYEQGYDAVKKYREQGYDFIKLTFDINEKAYNGIVKAGDDFNIPIIGHVSRKTGLVKALTSGQDIEHLDQYMDAIVGETSPTKEGLSAFGIFKSLTWQSVNHIDSAKLEEIISLTIENKIWNTPTNYFFTSSFAIGRSDEELMSSPEWDLVSKEVRDELLKYRERYWQSPPAEELRIKYVQTRAYVIREIYKRSGRILAGSDSPEWLNIYGSGLHRELKNLVECGLSPFEALTTATTKPAEYLGLSSDGQIRPGFSANSILLDNNPLEDINHIEEVSGIILNGKYMDKKALRTKYEKSKKVLVRASLRDN